MRASRPILVGAAVAGVCALAVAQHAVRQRSNDLHDAQNVRTAENARAISARTPRAIVAAPSAFVQTIILGGGGLPESTEVSLEQNVELALEVLPEPQAVFFAGGPGTQSVRVQARDDERAQRTLPVRLGELFAPRKGRTSQYRESVLTTAQRADITTLENALRAALTARAREPLLLYITAHGDQAEAAADNAVALWGNDSLTPRRLAELHDGSKRALHLVVTSCFSGGFAELAFEAADARKGFAHAPRCGLFAGTWDRETSGCDPDPDRSVQESYSLHFLHALALRDRDDRPLALSELDLDRDGSISLLEAHTRARIASRSIDVPTTTSERFLRESMHDAPRASTAGKPLALALPEEAAVIDRLGAALELRSERAANAKHEALTRARTAQDERVAEAEDALDARYWALVTALLERFPVLDDPYHPAFAQTVADHASAIEALLESSPQAHTHRTAASALDDLDRRALELELQETLVLRLVRAHETLRLARALELRGGKSWTQYQDLLACERSAVPTRAIVPPSGAIAPR